MIGARMRAPWLLPLCLTLPFAACGDEDTPDAAADSGVTADAGRDSGVNDTGTTPDSGVDSGTADLGIDGGVEMDAEPTDTGTLPDPFPNSSCAGTSECLQFVVGQENELLDAVNDLPTGTRIVLGAGTFRFTNAVTIRDDAITFEGQGIDLTILDFAGQVAQSNGVDVVGDNFTIEGMTITDSKKDALRIENSTNVVIRRVKATWSAGPATTNGSYGLYPVRCTNVLMEDSEAYNASDAGLYVGQSINVVVRRNIARRNVAGLEIENTQFADVYENHVEDNSGGLLIFDLPGNPVIGRDVKIHDNQIISNNRPNFAPSGTTVSQIPRGTGTFTLASRRVEITGNTYENNLTTDVAVLSGLAVQSSTAAWAIPLAMVVGSTVGLDLPSGGGVILNFVTNEIWVHGNTHSGYGTLPDSTNQTARPLGALLGLVYFGSGGSGPVDALLYDGIGELVDPDEILNNTNFNHICFEDETGATYATLDLPKLAAILDGGQRLPSTDDIYQPGVPWVPFDCTGFTGGPIPPVVLP